MSASKLYVAKVQRCLRQLQAVTFHSYNGMISETPYKREHDADGAKLAAILLSLEQEFGGKSISEVGIVDKIYEQTTLQLIFKRKNAEDFQKFIIDAENDLIRSHYKSSVVPELGKVDLYAPFSPTDAQVADALKHLHETYSWFGTSSRTLHHQYLDVILRSRHLPPIDLDASPEIRKHVLDELNKNLRFWRVEQAASSYAHIYVASWNLEDFEATAIKRNNSCSSIAYGTIFLERMDSGCSKILKAPFVTSSEILWRHAKFFPELENRPEDDALSHYLGIKLIIQALLDVHPRLTGRVGIKRHINDDIDWICSEKADLSVLDKHLPSTFKFSRYLSAGDLVRNCDPEKTKPSKDNNAKESIRPAPLEKVPANLSPEKTSAKVHIGGSFSAPVLRGSDMQAILDRFGIRYVWHFTDTSNLELIFEHGLLSYAELKRRSIAIPSPGGNEWSHEADRYSGVDDYVHLAFTDNHPMQHIAKNDGRLKHPVWIKIDSSIILDPLARFSNDVSNKSGVRILTPEEASEQVDFEVLFRRLDWNDPVIKARKKAAEKSEILIPRNIPVSKILEVNYG